MMDKIIKNNFRILIIVSVLGSLVGCKKTVEPIMEYNKPEGVTELETSISAVYGDADAIVTVISDDGYFTTAVNLNDIFGKRGLKCTVAGVVTIIQQDLFYWKIILNDGNIDLVSHSYNHIRMEEGTAIAENLDALNREIVDSDKWFEDTFGGEQIVFVCPENLMCENGYEILSENNFWAVRRGYRGYNSLSPEEGIEEGNWFNLRVQAIQDEGVDLSVRNGWIDTAISDNVWLIEMWHNVMAEDDGGYQTILISDAEAHLDYVAEKAESNDIWVATFDEAVKYIREKQNSEVIAYIDGGELHIYVELLNENMNYITFNQPLTVHVVIPEQMSLADTNNANIVDGELIINAVPGVEQIIKVVGD